MTTITMLHFTHEEQHEIPYQIIGETVNTSRWKTSSRACAYSQFFSENEQIDIFEYKIKSKATRWYLDKNGFPKEGYSMTAEEFSLWLKLARFCAEFF